jgi:anti-sigma factor RsiW
MHYDIDTLDDYLRGELDAARDAAVHAHLDACDACRASYEDAASVRDWLRAAAAAEEREFPSMIKARVWETVRAAAPSPFDRLRAGWRTWVAVPVAAVLALALSIGLPALHGTAQGGIAATDLLVEHAAQMSDNPLADHGVVVRASMLESNEATVPFVNAIDTTSIADPTGAGR